MLNVKCLLHLLNIHLKTLGSERKKERFKTGKEACTQKVQILPTTQVILSQCLIQIRWVMPTKDIPRAFGIKKSDYHRCILSLYYRKAYFSLWLFDRSGLASEEQTVNRPLVKDSRVDNL